MIRAYTFADIRADFVPYQARCIRKFLGDDVSFTVFNNTPGDRIQARKQIEDACSANGARNVQVASQDHQTANHAHAQALDWAWNNVIMEEDSDVSLILDFDMFPGRPMNLVAMMDEYQMAGHKQVRGSGVTYFWPGLMMLKTRELRDKKSLSFFCGKIDGNPVDVGGMLHNYFSLHPDVRRRWIRGTGFIERSMGNLDALPPSMLPEYDADNFKMSVFENAFVHYEGGSNWAHKPADLLRRKDAFLWRLLEALLSGDAVLPQTLPEYDPRTYGL